VIGEIASLKDQYYFWQTDKELSLVFGKESQGPSRRTYAQTYTT